MPTQPGRNASRTNLNLTKVYGRSRNPGSRPSRAATSTVTDDLPREFEGLYNIALISYSDVQQSDANKWLQALANIEDAYPYIRAYHLQVAGEMSWIGRERRDFQMSSDTTDPQTRTDTITLYTDASDFNGTLNVPDRSEITIALVDSFGNVMWRDRGRYTEAKIENLEYSIINHLANVRIYAEN